MNRLRFGALLLMRGQRFGLYLSHRVVLTVPKPGRIRATALQEFQPCQVLALNGVALPFFNALCEAVSSQESFSSSFDMIKSLLKLPDNTEFMSLFTMLQKQFGAGLEEFTLPVPEQKQNTPNLTQ